MLYQNMSKGEVEIEEIFSIEWTETGKYSQIPGEGCVP